VVNQASIAVEDILEAKVAVVEIKVEIYVINALKQVTGPVIVPMVALVEEEVVTLAVLVVAEVEEEVNQMLSVITAMRLAIIVAVAHNLDNRDQMEVEEVVEGVMEVDSDNSSSSNTR